MRRRTFSLAALFAVGLAAAPAAAQDNRPTPFVHMFHFQIPWSQVDSLNTLIQAYPERAELAVECGYVLDSQWLIHNQGDEWNVVRIITYPSFQAWANPETPGWAAQIFAEVEPDAEARTAHTRAINEILYDDAPHRDNFYNLVASARR